MLAIILILQTLILTLLLIHGYIIENNSMTKIINSSNVIDRSWLLYLSEVYNGIIDYRLDYELPQQQNESNSLLSNSNNNKYEVMIDSYPSKEQISIFYRNTQVRIRKLGSKCKINSIYLPILYNI